MVAISPKSDSLADVIGRILDKGLILHADIAVSVNGVELLGIKIRAALASFETAAKYGLAFPMGTNLDAPGWKNIDKTSVKCPECGNKKEEKMLLEEGCHICGWENPLKKRKNVIEA